MCPRTESKFVVLFVLGRVQTRDDTERQGQKGAVHHLLHRLRRVPHGSAAYAAYLRLLQVSAGQRIGWVVAMVVVVVAV